MTGYLPFLQLLPPTSRLQLGRSAGTSTGFSTKCRWSLASVSSTIGLRDSFLPFTSYYLVTMPPNDDSPPDPTSVPPDRPVRTVSRPPTYAKKTLGHPSCSQVSALGPTGAATMAAEKTIGRPTRPLDSATGPTGVATTASTPGPTDVVGFIPND